MCHFFVLTIFGIWCCLRSITDQTHGNMESIISPLKPKSDQHLVSPYNNTAELFIQDHENKGNDH